MKNLRHEKGYDVFFLFLWHHDVLQRNNHSYLVGTISAKKDW